MARKSQALYFTNRGYAYAYQRSATTPVGSPGNCQFNFGLGKVVAPTTLPNSWEAEIPPGDEALWVTVSAVSSSTTLAFVPDAGWSPAVIMIPPTPTGTTSSRGSVHAYVSGVSSWSDTAADNALLAAYGNKVVLDVVTLSDSAAGFAQTKVWNGAAWVSLAQVLDGNLLVNGTVLAQHINSRGLDILHPDGSVLITTDPALAAMDFAKIGGATRPADNATVGANSSNLKVGIGTNIIPNSDFSSGIQNWYTGSIAGGGTNFDGPVWDLNGTANIPSGGHAVGMVRTGNTLAAAGGADIYFKPLSVTAGAFYEATCFLASHRCDMEMIIEWLTSTDTHVSFTSVGSNNSNRLTGGVDIRNWHRVELLVSAPGTATKAKIILRGSAVDSGFSDPYFWGTKPMLAPALPGQTEFSPWRSGESSGAFAEVDTLHPGNIGVYMPVATIGSAQVVEANINTLHLAVDNVIARRDIIAPYAPYALPSSNTSALVVSPLILPSLASGLLSDRGDVEIVIDALVGCHATSNWTMVISIDFSQDSGLTWSPYVFSGCGAYLTATTSLSEYQPRFKLVIPKTVFTTTGALYFRAMMGQASSSGTKFLYSYVFSATEFKR